MQAQNDVAPVIAGGGWEVTNRIATTPMFGLIRLESTIRIPPPAQGGHLLIRFGSVERLLPLSSVLVRTSQDSIRLRVHLVTHCFSNGLNELTARLLLPDCPTIELPKAQYHVENIGALADAVREDLFTYGTPPIIGAIVDSRMWPQVRGLAKAWFNEPELVTDIPLSLEPSPTAEAARLHLIRWGFAVLNHRISSETIRQFRQEYEEAIDNQRLKYQRGTSQRIQLAHRLPTGRKIWLDPQVIGFLQEWFRDEPCACQTLLYIHGSQQDAHQDTIHLTPYPAGFMCGVWVALQDVQPESGELFVIPGSHRTPRLMAADVRLPKVTDDYSAYTALTARVEAIIEEGKYEQIPYRPKAGQILVWHENLIHGGERRKILDRQRHSIVSHYFARGSIAYYDSRGEGAALERVE